MEGRHGRPTRILCINCNIWVFKMRRYRALELDTRVTTLLCSWVHPRIITEDDYVCEACKDLAMQRVASSCDNHQAGLSDKGHNHVCILCGFSILRRQNDKILRDNPTQLQKSMINILESRISPQQITVSDRICHPCWLRIQREARRYGNFTDDDTRTLPSSADTAPEESQEDDQPGPNSSEPSPVRIEKKESEREMEQMTETRRELRVSLTRLLESDSDDSQAQASLMTVESGSEKEEALKNWKKRPIGDVESEEEETMSPTKGAAHKTKRGRGRPHKKKPAEVGILSR